MCEKCEIGSLFKEDRNLPEPVEVTKDRIVIHPDLMTFMKTYWIKYKGDSYSIAKTDIGTLVIWRYESEREDQT